MTTIEHPLLRGLVAESSDLAVKVSQAIANATLTDDYLNNLSASVGNKGQQMQQSMARDRSNENTQELQAADGLRDSLFIALKYFIRGFLSWNKATTAAHAHMLWNIIEKHGVTLDREPYQEQSALMGSLLNDFSQAAAVEAIKTLQLNEVVAELRGAGESFDQLFVAAAEAEGNREEVMAASNIKKVVMGELSDLADYLNTMAKANAATYGAVANTMAELVNTFNQKVRNRIR